MANEPLSDQEIMPTERTRQRTRIVFSLVSTIVWGTLFLASAVFTGGNWPRRAVFVTFLIILQAFVHWPTKSLKEPLSDDEIIELERNRYRVRMRTGLYAVLAMTVVLFFTTALVNRNYLSNLRGLIAFGIIVLSWVAFFVLNFWRNRPPTEAFAERILRKRIDEYQARAWFVPLVLPLGLLSLANNPLTQLPFDIVLFVLPCAFFVCFGPGPYWKSLNDELTVALLGKSVLVGYLATMGLLGGLYIAAFYDSALAIRLGPYLLIAGITIPMLYFLFLQWQAGRGG